MKYSNLKTNALQLLFFTAIWIFQYRNYVSFDSKISDTNTFSLCFMSSGWGYNDSTSTVGIVFTFLFCFMFFRIFNITDSSIIIRYGRNHFFSNEIKESIKYSFFFSLEFWAVNTVFIMIFCDFNLLSDLKFFGCNILYFVIKFLYFLLIAMFMQLVRFAMNFNKLYFTVSALLILAVNLLSFLSFEKGIIYFASFIDVWFTEGTFDLFEYIRNVIICILTAGIFITAAKLIFIKKDILIDAEEN